MCSAVSHPLRTADSSVFPPRSAFACDKSAGRIFDVSKYAAKPPNDANCCQSEAAIAAATCDHILAAHLPCCGAALGGWPVDLTTRMDTRTFQAVCEPENSMAFRNQTACEAAGIGARGMGPGQCKSIGGVLTLEGFCRGIWCPGAACAAGTTFSASGNAPCAPCTVTCGAAGVKTACTATADTVCIAAEPPATLDACPSGFQKCSQTSDCDTDAGG